MLVHDESIPLLLSRLSKNLTIMSHCGSECILLGFVEFLEFVYSYISLNLWSLQPLFLYSLSAPYSPLLSWDSHSVYVICLMVSHKPFVICSLFFVHFLFLLPMVDNFCCPVFKLLFLSSGCSNFL